MGELIEIEAPGEKALKERAHGAEALRTLATRMETLPETKLLHALPIAASSVPGLERRLLLERRAAGMICHGRS